METREQDKILRLVHWNSNSLFNKQHNLFNFINIFKPDIISINESKLSEYRFENEIFLKNLPNYNFIHKHRHKNINGAGGVGLIIKNEINFSICNELDFLELETLCVKIESNNKDIYIVSYYNPPDCAINAQIFEILEEKNFILVGDLNSRSVLFGESINNQNGVILNSLILNNNLICLNNQQPTHINFASKEESILDFSLITSSIHDLFESFEVLDDFNMGSDHSPLLIKLNMDINKKNITTDYLKTDWEMYKLKLPTKYPDNILGNVDEMNTFITNSILKAHKESTTKQTAKNGTNLPIYIQKLIKTKKKIKNRLKKHKSKELSTKYNSLNLEIKNEINSHNNNSWQKFLDSINKSSTNSKVFWDRINTLKGNKKSSSSIPTLKDDNLEFKTDLDKALLFGTKLETTFRDSNEVRFKNDYKLEIEREVNNFLTNNFNNNSNRENLTFDISDFDLSIKQLKIKSSPGFDNITNKHLIYSSDNFKKLILILFNETLKQSKLPETWKLSTITMIPKKNKNSSNPKDYRPISLVSCLGKLCERLLLLKLTHFIESNKIIIKQQAGFRKHRQTKDNIFVLIQKITESFNRKSPKKVLGLFFDIASAFDKVWHNGLLYKMIKNKIPRSLILWVNNFLTNRFFMVKVNDSLSEKLEISAGVPQGAVLSPTLFSIFINDIPKVEKKNSSNSLLFADDLASFLIFRKTDNKLIKTINNYLMDIENWLCKWRLTMAPNKCNFIVFSKSQVSQDMIKKIQPELFKEEIPHTDLIKFLGINFDSKLSFSQHFKLLIDSCTKRLNIIKILSNKKWKINSKILIQIYTSLIRSLFDYSSLLYSSLSKENKRKLQVIQNSAFRIIFKKPKITPIDELHKLANLELVESRLNKLNRKYFLRGIALNNPMIKEQIDEFLNFTGARILKHETPLCSHKTDILILLNSLIPP